MRTKDDVRRMMDGGATADTIASLLVPNGRRRYRPRAPHGAVKFTARLVFTPQQWRRINDNAPRYGAARPAILMERLLAVIADDDLFVAILGDSNE